MFVVAVTVREGVSSANRKLNVAMSSDEKRGLLGMWSTMLFGHVDTNGDPLCSASACGL
jgi:hypothetical protein